MKNGIKIEVCCGSFDDCLTAWQHGADRIELNSALELGGLTPSLATLIRTKEAIPLPVCCMVRPRTAGFVYSQEQFKTMLMDAEILLNHGADGIVFGFLTADNSIDRLRTKSMTELIHRFGKEAVFHKAFDQCADLHQAFSACLDLGIDRILTSGGSRYPDIESGCIQMRQMIEEAQGRIKILPGGGVRAHNIRKILDLSKATQIHMTAKQEFADHGHYVAVDASTLTEILNQI